MFKLLTNLAVWSTMAICAIVAAVILVPIAIVIITGFLTSQIGSPSATLTLAHYQSLLSDASALPQLLVTLEFSLGSSIIAVALATLFAWAVTFVDVPFKRWVRLIPILVMILPPLLKDPAWIELYSPKIGLVNLLIKNTIGLKVPVFNIYTLWGMIILVGVNIAPISYTILLAPFESLDRAFEEASRMSGARPWWTLTKITIPILAPAFLSAIALSTIMVASSFETPILVGLPAGIITYMSAIYASVTGTVMPDLNHAAAQSTVYLILTGALLTWYMMATRRERRFVSITSKASTRRQSAPALVRRTTFAAFVIYFVIAFVLPIAVTVLVALLPYYSVTSGNPLKPGLSLVNFNKLAATTATVSALWTSIWVSAVTMVTTIGVSLGLAYLAFKTRLPGRRFAELLGTLPISIPSMVFGLALLITFVSVPGARLIYATYVPMLIAMVVIFLPFSIRVISAAMIQVDDSLLEAGTMSGARRGVVVRDILIPILGPALLNAAALVFILSFRELGAVVLLIAPNTELVPTVTFNYWINADLGAVAALNIVALFVPALVLAVSYVVIRALVWLNQRRNRLVLPAVAPIPVPVARGA
jgi:iron(III) transport system permease protein